MALKKQAASLIYAPLWKRILAFAIDFIVIDTFVLIPFAPVIENFSKTINFESLVLNEALMSQMAYIFIAVSVMVILYFSIFEYYLRQSIGKMAFNIYVISDYKKMFLWQALVRNILYLPIIPFIFLWIADPIFLAFKNQRLSEMITATRTVEAEEFLRTINKDMLEGIK